MLSRRRRLLAVLLAAASTGCIGLAIRPTPSTEVIAAARDLPGGRLAASDVTVIKLPAESVPDGALSPGAQLTGRILTAPARRGEPLTDFRLLGPTLVDAYGAGTLATPVRITDAGSAALLRAGDVIDVLAATPRWDDALPPRTTTVAQAVTVITTPNSAAPSDSTEPGALVVLATTPDQAAHLAEASAGSRLTITIHGHHD
ncbi:Flp pilus assembly protein CpaB [Sphaerisporangium fuscum]|uniref:Flp pilus assembly protein CpaB n=1 Tax=Sphaerisporangium fuscum TaxID=2835868 RepID=UPI002029A5BA|nr:Flp pilus assembly protein CpaB [Sphaerisporangium fuscum]